MTHLIERLLGLTSASGTPYLFWSGIAGDLPMFGILGVVYRKHTCHVDRCWRLGLHHVTGTPLTVCRKHHPAVPAQVTAAHVQAVSR